MGTRNAAQHDKKVSANMEMRLRHRDILASGLGAAAFRGVEYALLSLLLQLLRVKVPRIQQLLHDVLYRTVQYSIQEYHKILPVSSSEV